MKYHRNIGWSEYPFVRLCIPLIVGILFFDASQFYRSNHPVLFFAIFSLLLLGAVFVKIDSSFRHRWVLGCFFFMSVFFLGGLLLNARDLRMKSDYLIPKKIASACVVASLYEAPRDAKRGRRCLLRLEKKIEGGLVENASGLVMAYFIVDSSMAAGLHYGDRILFRQERIGPERAAANPGGFDYRTYLAQKQVYYSCALSSKDFLHVPGNSGHWLVALSYRLRDALLLVYKTNGIGEEQFGVLAALVLGYTQEIENDLTAAYAAAGVTHVLSVSGMHVGLIYVLLTYALSWLGVGPKARGLRAFVLLAFLWFYALLTGLSPAVLRAATMLSLIVIGKAWKKQENTINTVAASAFLLLLMNPWLLYDVGFQLSYLAVCGIVFIHPYIYDWFSPEPFWLDQIWSLVSVSLAAQITTCIPAMYYFHQFPLLFLITNVLVIPLSTLIIYGGIALLACAPFPFIAKYVGLALDNMVFALNAIVRYVHDLPFALLEGIWIDRLDVLLLHLWLISFVLYLLNKRPRPLLSFLSVTFVMLVYHVYSASNLDNQRMLVLYSLRGQTALDLINGKQHVFISSFAMKDYSGLMKKVIQPAWGKLHVKKPQLLSLQSFELNSRTPRLTLIVHEEKRLLILAGDFRRIALEKIDLGSVDDLLLYRNTKVSVRDLLIAFKPRRIIADGASSRYNRRQWREVCTKWGVPFQDVIEEGAIVQAQ